MTTSLERELDRCSSLDPLLDAGAVRSVYQPIVDLDSGATVAYEALARGPYGHPLERPDHLFDAARRAGRTGELDQLCRQVALRGARGAGLVSPWTLFVNVEPAGLDWLLARGDDSEQSDPTGAGVPVVIEITERDLTCNPVGLLQFVNHVRSLGYGIALDDVGADRASLALLPLLRPDVIKLDLALIQQHPTGEVAEIFSAVTAEAERSGAVILAEGIETERHRDIARGMGARLGQGWLLGRPAPLPSTLPAGPVEPVRVARQPALGLGQSVFDLVAGIGSARPARKPLLIEVSKHLEREALRIGANVVVLSTFQDETFLTPATRRRYRRLAASATFVAVLGAGIAARPFPGVRGGRLSPADPLIGEWDVAVLGPHFAAALVARDLGDTGPDMERRFEYVLTYDRDVVVRIAAGLISRVLPDR